jgi:pimeloyl-ACP methyl ester carboxylesterase
MVSMDKIRFRFLYLTLCLSIILTACGALPIQKIDLQSCQVSDFAAECGTLSVFEDRATNSGRMIDIFVAVIKAHGENPAPDPVFWLAGGPGSSAVEDVSYAMRILGSANEQRDVVFVDQRGTGLSNELACDATTDPLQTADVLRTCLANMDADPSAYTTAWGMDDLDDVRAALGYERINLYGGSYGGTSGQVYIQRHGKHVRTATFDGVSLLDVPMFERYPISSQNALDLLFERCEKDATCHSTFPNLRMEFTAALAQLEQSPATMPINDPSTGQPYVLTGEVFRTTIHNGLAATPTAVFLPHFIHLVYSQDWNGLATFMAPFMDANPEVTQWQMMNLTILCHEDWAKIRPDETTAASTGSYLTYEDVRELTVLEDICAIMPPPKEEALYGPVKNSLVPIVLFNGEADPQDPPENAADARQHYPNSLHLIVPGQAHGFTDIPCRASIVTDFIKVGSIDGLDVDCLQHGTLPPFNVDE